MHEKINFWKGFPPSKHAATPAPGEDLLSQSKAFQLDSGSFGDVNDLGKLNFNLWFIFTHNTWKRNANERQVLAKKSIFSFWNNSGELQWKRRELFLFSLWDDFVFPLLSLALSQDAIPLEIMSKKQHKHNTAADTRHAGVQWSVGGMDSDLMRPSRCIEPLLSEEFVVVLTVQESEKRASKNPSERHKYVYKSVAFTVGEGASGDSVIAAVKCLFQTWL